MSKSRFPFYVGLWHRNSVRDVHCLLRNLKLAEIEFHLLTLYQKSAIPVFFQIFSLEFDDRSSGLSTETTAKLITNVSPHLLRLVLFLDISDGGDVWEAVAKCMELRSVAGNLSEDMSSISCIEDLPNVKELSLMYLQDDFGGLDGDGEVSDLNDVLVPLAESTLLPRLHSLTLTAERFKYNEPAAVVDAITAPCPSLKIFRAEEVYWRGPRDLLDTLLRMPALEELSLDQLCGGVEGGMGQEFVRLLTAHRASWPSLRLIALKMPCGGLLDPAHCVGTAVRALRLTWPQVRVEVDWGHPVCCRHQ